MRCVGFSDVCGCLCGVVCDDGGVGDLGVVPSGGARGVPGRGSCRHGARGPRPRRGGGFRGPKGEKIPCLKEGFALTSRPYSFVGGF